MPKHLTHEQIRQKYMQMIQTAGLDQAIMALHREIGNRLEPGVFQGGYDKERLEEVTFLRQVARDLYNYKLEQDSKEYMEKK